MEDLTSIAKVIGLGGNAALILCAYYIYKSEQTIRFMSERLARIEAKLNINAEQEK